MGGGELGGRDREKLEESESVCECNSLPLSNPREFTDCGKEETARTKEGGGGGCDHGSERRERGRQKRGRQQEKERWLQCLGLRAELAGPPLHFRQMQLVISNKIQHED